ncbi:MAG: hypothetical protein ACRDQA_24715 [Nocardioidaceae bacterium]
MDYAEVNGIRLGYEMHGDSGSTVLFLGGSGMPGFALLAATVSVAVAG